jgi:hypothetical protein
MMSGVLGSAKFVLNESINELGVASSGVPDSVIDSEIDSEIDSVTDVITGVVAADVVVAAAVVDIDAGFGVGLTKAVSTGGLSELVLVTLTGLLMLLSVDVLFVEISMGVLIATLSTKLSVCGSVGATCVGDVLSIKADILSLAT